MFRAAPNHYDELVVKATDEKLTTEDWAINIDLCDKVNEEKETGARQVISALQKRLAHRNPNVQLFALELTNTLSENCGSLIHQEIASKSFTEGLERIVVDRTTNDKVRKKVLMLIKKWAQLFEGDGDLGLVEELYDRLQKNNEYRSVLSESSIHESPPDEEIARARAAAEEEEMQRVLELSKQETGGRNNSYQPPSFSSNANNSASSSSAAQHTSSSHAHGSSSSAAAARKEVSPLVPEVPALEQATRVRALYDYTPTNPTELALQAGDVIKVIGRTYDQWWRGTLRGRVGIFPVNYVESLPVPTWEEMRRERDEEDEVFGSVAKFDMLLEKLRGIDVARGDRVDDDREIEELYSSCLGLQGTISSLIAKYAGQKADLEQISNIFNQASHQYELMRSQPPPQQAQPVYAQHPPPHAQSSQHSASSQHLAPQQQHTSQIMPQQRLSSSPAPQHAQPQAQQGGPPSDPAWAAYYASQAAATAQTQQGGQSSAYPSQPQGGQSPAYQPRPEPVHHASSSSVDVSQYPPQNHPSQQPQYAQQPHSQAHSQQQLHPSHLMHQQQSSYGSQQQAPPLGGGSGSSTDGQHRQLQGGAPVGGQQPPYYQPQQ